MLKSKGFTIIEILTTITIMAIVASIAAPEFWRLKNRDDFRAEGQGLFDSILDARNSALTNRFCSNGNTSVRWMVLLDSNRTPPVYDVRCYWDDTNSNTKEQADAELTKSEIELIDFNEGNTPDPMYGTVAAPYPDNIRFSFFSGGVNGRLEYSDGGIVKANSVKMVLGHNTTDYVHTICFNRVSGFPTFNKTGDECQDY
ncbi:prepilin-type N-terminal cleavage/methylation domain-containing protein [bacterium]|nr:prepilin-type N-terminal cleavage/methylation domain-containing protein [bacterium]NCQ54770.1 prepilin-type N-terminal cleavage/methylation domain-containing protein [Candidatus Parcubacteria bacterium]NCS68023.1 prepilin-type N-terminal cleavage/methylation domain-containing protein [Candidatus Peregrinibacteria bacterium]NCS95760.1 prepilin-type N-terminal cleavage/methylation domain-containing protein [bacterium]